MTPAGTRRVLVWRGLDAWRAEIAEVSLESGGLLARGTQIGVAPEPYRLEYELETESGFLTRSLVAETFAAGGSRSLDLRRGPDGSWTANGDPLAGVAGALDCDLQHCPLTNTMPVLREGLLEGGEPRDFVMAWVKVPELSVHRSEQRYEPIDATTVRYVGSGGDFVAELDFDSDGLVLRYPGLGERV